MSWIFLISNLQTMGSLGSRLLIWEMQMPRRQLWAHLPGFRMHHPTGHQRKKIMTHSNLLGNCEIADPVQYLQSLRPAVGLWRSLPHLHAAGVAATGRDRSDCNVVICHELLKMTTYSTVRMRWNLEGSMAAHQFLLGGTQHQRRPPRKCGAQLSTSGKTPRQRLRCHPHFGMTGHMWGWRLRW